MIRFLLISNMTRPAETISSSWIKQVHLSTCLDPDVVKVGSGLLCRHRWHCLNTALRPKRPFSEPLCFRLFRGRWRLRVWHNAVLPHDDFLTMYRSISLGLIRKRGRPALEVHDVPSKQNPAVVLITTFA